jgi:uncharacterized protein YuzE
MKIHYDSEQDQLHVAFSSGAGFESEEVAEGIVFDYDKAGSVVGMDIEHAVARMHLPAIARRDLIRTLESATAAVVER